MWPFRGTRRRDDDPAAKAFSRYLSPAPVEELMRADRSLGMGVTPARVHFLLALFRDSDLAKVRGNVSKAVDIIAAAGLVDHIGCSMISAAFGLVPRDDDDRAIALRRAAATRLLAEIGADVKVLIGDADGVHGNLGSERRLWYGYAVPNFSAYVSKLLQLDFGQMMAAGDLSSVERSHD